MKTKKLCFSILTLTIVGMAIFTYEAKAWFTDAAAALIDGITTSRGEQLDIFDSNSIEEIKDQAILDKEQAKIDEYLPEYNSIINQYNGYLEALADAENDKMWAEHDINYASDMIDAICSGENGGSTSDPALQHYLNMRDEAREDLRDAEFEIRKQNRNINIMGSSVGAAKNKMKSLERNRDAWAHEVHKHNSLKENARTKFNELTEDLWDIYDEAGVPRDHITKL